MVALLAMVYAGLVIGVSFIATPAKFLAADVAFADLLLVGRVTFGVFAWVDAAMALGLLLAAVRSRCVGPSVIVIVLLVAVQHLALQPILDDRITAYVAGTPPPASWVHHLYGLGEIVKVVLLVVIAARCRRRAATGDARPHG